MRSGDTYGIPGGAFTVCDDHTMTLYNDGTLAEGAYAYDDESRERAVSLGYEDSYEGITLMHQEHELLHSIVAEAIGRPRSAALYDWNRYGNAMPGAIPLEERICFLVARALNDGRSILDERKFSPTP